jgi:hypothetical protein
MYEDVRDLLREARDHVHGAMCSLECLQNFVDEIGNVDDVDELDEFFCDEIGKLANEICFAIEHVDELRRGISRLARSIDATTAEQTVTVKEASR